MSVATTTPPRHPGTEKKSVALLSVLAATVMTILKLVAGLLTGSLGMLSDAAHSGLDLLGAALTFFSVHISDKPADDDHPYGHAKIENVSAFAETFLMAVSCMAISAEAIKRIFFTPFEVRSSIWPFLILLLSMAVDYWRSRELGRVAKRHQSHALEADAMHFASDIWSSAAVLVGLAASWVGERAGLAWLRYADPVAAIAVSILILRYSWQLARKTVWILLDAAPPETRERIEAELRRTDGVLDVDQARVRKSGNTWFADLTLALPRHFTFQRTEQLTHEATLAVQRVLPGADVVIHTVPRATLAESVFDRVRAVASRNNVMLHDVSIQSYNDKLHVEQHIEVAEQMPLRTAHDFVRSLEDEIRHELPQIGSVLTHIESEPATIEHSVSIERNRRIEDHLREAARHIPEVLDIHEIVIGRIGDKLQLSCHCTLPDDLPMGRVHDLITQLEGAFRFDCPEVFRVLIHPEPSSDNHHR